MFLWLSKGGLILRFIPVRGYFHVFRDDLDGIDRYFFYGRSLVEDRRCVQRKRRTLNGKTLRGALKRVLRCRVDFFFVGVRSCYGRLVVASSKSRILYLSRTTTKDICGGCAVFRFNSDFFVSSIFNFFYGQTIGASRVANYRGLVRECVFRVVRTLVQRGVMDSGSRAGAFTCFYRYLTGFSNAGSPNDFLVRVGSRRAAWERIIFTTFSMYFVYITIYYRHGYRYVLDRDFQEVSQGARGLRSRFIDDFRVCVIVSYTTRGSRFCALDVRLFSGEDTRVDICGDTSYLVSFYGKDDFFIGVYFNGFGYGSQVKEGGLLRGFLIMIFYTMGWSFRGY